MWTVEVPGLISGRLPDAGYRRRMMRSALVFLDPGQRERGTACSPISSSTAD